MSVNPFQAIALHGAAGASVALYPYAAHLTSWIGADGRERLFTSATAELRSGAAIRGGVPIIFPQFAGFGPLPKHGFARTALWQVSSISNDSAVLQLVDNEQTRAIWPQQFLAEYRVTISDDALSMQLAITNTGANSFSFTAALHTYLRVQHIAQVMIAGLQGLRYSDSAAGGVESTESAPLLRIAGEVDRIYFSTTQPITVSESGQRAMRCGAEGFTDTVVWNPGAEKAATMADLEVDGYRHMVCVEAAVIESSVVLVPGTTWSGTQRLTLV